MTLRTLSTLISALALLLSACGGVANDSESNDGGPVVPGDRVAGADAYRGTCSGCHGRNLEGIETLGSQLAPNEFVSSSTEDQLASLIAEGRPSDDPENTTGINMPAQGGNPSLTNQDVQDIAAYLQSEN